MGMSNTGCCCGGIEQCRDCPYDARICCIKVINSAWNMYAILTDPLNREFYSGDTCGGPRPTPTSNTNICGAVESMWWMPAGAGDPPEPARPGWDNTLHTCMPNISLKWHRKPGDCNTVVWEFLMDYRGFRQAHYVEVSKDWYLTSITFRDDWYYQQNETHPLSWPDIGEPQFTVLVCPETFDEFPAPEGRVYLKLEVQTEVDGEWFPASGDFFDMTNPVSAYGNLVCGSRCVSSGGRAWDNSLGPWWYNLYTDQIYLYWGSSHFLSLLAESPIIIDYMDGDWPDNIPEIGGEVFLNEYTEDGKIVFQRVDECVEGSSENTPPPPICTVHRVCLMLTVPEEGSGETDYAIAPVSLFYALVWNSETQQYELAATAVPSSKPYTIEVEMVEDAGSLPVGSPAGSRAWLLHVTIKEVPSGTIVYEHTFVEVIDCSSTWSREHELEVPISPAETWLLHIGTKCPDPPKPPSCDPGCWPSCVLCPSVKSMSLVVDQSPDCCLHGSFGLTRNSGTDSFDLAAPVGGPDGTCGIIQSFKMTCVDSTHVHFQMTYKDVNGSTNTVSTTVSASCSGGSFETAAWSLPSSVFFPVLCEAGFGKGASVRVVGI